MRLLIVTQKVNQEDPILGFFHRWIIEFAKHCESVTVICLEEGAHEFPANTRVLSLGKERAGGKLGYMARFYKYIWQQRSQYDVVFVHMNPIYVILGGLIWKMLRKNIFLWYTHKHVDWKLKVAEKIVDRVFTASQESFRLPSKKVIVTGHGIDTDHFCPSPRQEAPDVLQRTASFAGSQDAFRVLTTGRVAPVKNIHLMIEAVGKLVKDGKNILLTIVGDAVTDTDRIYSDTVKDMVSKQGLTESVKFVGPVVPQEIVTYLQDANLFINMSNTGSVDKAVLEAFACGVPVVSSNVAFKEILELHELFMHEQTASGCAESLRTVIGRDLSGVASSLRDYVVSKHSLYNLIPLLINYMYHEAGR